MLTLKNIALGGVLLLLFCCDVQAHVSNDLIKKLYLTERKGVKAEEGVSLSGEFGVLTTKGNTNTSTFKAGLTSEHETKNWSNRYFSEMIYKQNELETDTVVTAQRFLINAQLDYKLSTENKRLFVYAEYEDDRFSGFRYQSAIATGFSAHAWREEASQLRYSIGPGYSYSEREIVDEANHKSYDVFKEAIIRASLDYRLRLSKTSRFRQFLSTESGQENNRSRSETTLTANIIDSLAMKFSVVLLYNDNVLQNNDDLSTETSISLVYQFF
jgi:putative salt-induced outer membrane protein YdiY